MITFTISLFQLCFVTIIVLLKWSDNSWHYLPSIPSGTLAIGVLAIFLLVIIITGIGGFIENKHGNVDKWMEQYPPLSKCILLLKILFNAMIFIIWFSLLIFDQIISPLLLGAFLFGIILIQNMWDYFKEKHANNPAIISEE